MGCFFLSSDLFPSFGFFPFSFLRFKRDKLSIEFLGSFMAYCIACHLNVNDNEMRALCTTAQDPSQLKPAEFVWAYGAETPPSPVFRV